MPARLATQPDFRLLQFPTYPQAPDVPQYVGDADAVAGGDGLSASERAILKRQVDDELADLGVCYRGRIWRLFALQDVAEALREVRQTVAAGQRIANPAGLFIRVLEGNTGQSVFR